MWLGHQGPLTLALLCFVSLSAVSCGTGGIASQEQTSVPASPPKFLSDGFESGNFSKWSFVWNSTDVTINDHAAFAQTGTRSAQFHYSICSVCGAAHQDTNRFLEFDFNAANGSPNGVDHVFVRGSVYFKSPEPGGSIEIQRKLFYIKSPSGEGGVPNAYWSVVLTSDGVLPGKVQLYLLIGNSALGGTTTRLWTATDPSLQLEFDRWYDIQIEVRANAPGQVDGRIGLWLDGAKVYDGSSLDIRRDSDLGIRRIEIGHQADRAAYLPVDEYRYWDDLRVSDSFIP